MPGGRLEQYVPVRCLLEQLKLAFLLLWRAFLHCGL